MAVQSRSKPHNWGILLPAGILLFLTAIAYCNSFGVPFVFDDLNTIQANSQVQFGETLRPSIFRTRPILYMTFAIDYALHGQQVWGYHLVNLILHFLNGFLVFLIAQHIFRSSVSSESKARTYALLSAGFFVVHPVQTEAVTYISSRSELLSTAFYGFAVLAFIKRDPRKIGFLWSLIIAVLFVLGLFSKETVISLPVVLVAYDFLFFSGASFLGILKRWRFYITFVTGGIGAVWFLVTASLRHSIGITVSHISAWQYFLTELRVIVTYLRLLVFPVGLNLDYDFQLSSRLLDFPVAASLLALIALLLTGWYLRRRQAVISFSIFWFFITLAPTSSFISIPDVIFEHRLYLPLMGVSLAFPLLMGYVAEVLKLKFHLPVTAASTAVISLLVVGTVLRNQVWRDEVTLWNDVIAKSPHKTRPYNNQERAYFIRGDFDHALEVARQGFRNVENASDRRTFQQLIGDLYIQMHRYEEAAAVFRETANISDKSGASMAYNNLGVAYVYMAGTKSGADKHDLLTKAAEAFRKSTELDENMFLAFDSYVNVVYDSGGQEELEKQFQSTLKAKQDYRAYYGLGKIAFLSRDYAQAAQYFENALRINPEEKLIFFNQAYALSQLQRRDEAKDKYLQAIRLDPLFLQARHNLALLYMESNDLTKAIDSFENVLRLDPNYVAAHMNLARIYLRLGNRDAAREHVSRVLSIMPGHKEAAALWRQLES
jgi:tetratricopeptide (TPR) repeat protein